MGLVLVFVSVFVSDMVVSMGLGGGGGGVDGRKLNGLSEQRWDRISRGQELRRNL